MTRMQPIAIMAHHRQSPEEFLREAKRVVSTSCATIKLNSTHLSRLCLTKCEITPNPELRWMISKPGIVTSHTVPGTSAIAAKLFATNLDAYSNNYNTFIIPGNFYAFGTSEWPYKEALKDGRPFSDIFEWIHIAFTKDLDEVTIDIPHYKADALCVYLVACNILGMTSQAEQLEKHILDIITYRGLSLLEIQAIWKHASVPHPWGASEIPAGFSNANVIPKFAANLVVSTRAWETNSPKDPEFVEMLAKFEVWMEREGGERLKKLLLNAGLRAHVEYVQKEPSKAWKNTRMSQWVQENYRNFGRGAAVEMPALEGIWWYDLRERWPEKK